jgi:hypothetical protein
LACAASGAKAAAIQIVGRFRVANSWFQAPLRIICKQPLAYQWDPEIRSRNTPTPVGQHCHLLAALNPPRRPLFGNVGMFEVEACKAVGR